MVDNRSLDEFVGGEESGESATTAPEPDDETGEPAGDGPIEPAQDADDDDAVEPMTETFAWSPTGGECATCGETVEVRWRDEDGLVCDGCKVW